MSTLPRFTNPANHSSLTVRERGLVDYAATWREMQAYTDTRTADSADELWLLQHPPVFTLGRNHGPGQLIAYPLLDLKRRRLGIQSLVRLLEQSVINLLADYSIRAGRRDKAPGVYVDGRKIAALGLRVRRGCCYHGLSLNVNMDLAPFSMINPCGIANLEVTQFADLGIDVPLDTVSMQYRLHLERLLDGPAHE